MQTTTLERGAATAGGRVRPLLPLSSVVVSTLAAGSGLLLLGWVALHVLGVLGAFGGAAAMDGYAAVLHRIGPLLWSQRLILLLAAAVHVAAVVSLTRRAWRSGARVRGERRYRRSSWAGRSMRWSGAALLVFIVLHILHMTTGHLHPAFVEGGAYHNLVTGLRARPVAAGYALAALLIALHTRHGVLAVLRGFAASSRTQGAMGDRVGLWVALLIGGGFALVPIAVALGVLR